MKRLFIISLFLLSVVLGQVTTGQQNTTNLTLFVANNVASWSADVVTDPAYTGGKFLKLTYTPGTATDKVPAIVFKKEFNPAVSASLEVSWKAYSPSTSKPNFVLSLQGPNGQSTTQMVALTKAGNWNSYSALMNISGFSGNTYYIGINSPDLQGEKIAYIDEIRIGGVLVEGFEGYTDITLGTPILSLPLDGATNFALNGGIASWSTVPPVTGGIVTYSIQVSTNQNFSSFVVNQNVTGTTSYTFTNLSTNTIYYWRVRANEGTQVSAWSSVRSFNTGTGTTLPTAPTLGSPANGATGVLINPELIYNLVVGITGYQLELREGTQTGQLINNLVYTASPITLNGLKYNTVYWWRLGSIGSNGIGWSEWRSFTTMQNPVIAAPVLLSPVSGSTGMVTPLSLVWVAVQSALNYEVQISKTMDFSTLEYAATPPNNYQNVSVLYTGMRYYWRVKAIGTSSTSAWSEIWSFMIGNTTDVDDQNLPTQFALLQNYPNPFNPTTSIKYDVSSIQYINITAYDILGREVAVLVNEQKTPGRYEVQFDGSKLSSGIYIYKFQAGNFSATKKMILMK